MSFLGIPISYIYIYATDYTVQAFDGNLWPQRLIGFAMGIVSFAFLHDENVVIKKAIEKAIKKLIKADLKFILRIIIVNL